MNAIKGDEYPDEIVVTIFCLKIVFLLRMDERDCPSQAKLFTLLLRQKVSFFEQKICVRN
jgi:hypothetical protein